MLIWYRRFCVSGMTEGNKEKHLVAIAVYATTLKSKVSFCGLFIDCCNYQQTMNAFIVCYSYTYIHSPSGGIRTLLFSLFAD